jgi:hypothetical protein
MLAISLMTKVDLRSLHLHILGIGHVELLKISGSNQVVNEAVMRNVLKVGGLEHGHKKHFSEFPAEICQILLIKCQCILFYVGSEVLKMVVMKSFIFWDITPCSLSKANRYFRGTCPFYIQGQRMNTARNQCEARQSVDFQCTTQYYIPEDRILQFYNSP